MDPPSPNLGMLKIAPSWTVFEPPHHSTETASTGQHNIADRADSLQSSRGLEFCFWPACWPPVPLPTSALFRSASPFPVSSSQEVPRCSESLPNSVENHVCSSVLPMF